MQGEKPQAEAPTPAAVPKRKRRAILYVGAVVVALLLAVFLVQWIRNPAPPKIAYSGDSASLRQTVIVPTLDTPLPTGKNVIWCASFQIAWNHLKDDLIKAPVKLQNAEAVAEKLNQSRQSEADLPTGACYATAGWVKDGIIKTIQKTLAKRFPAIPKPVFQDTGPLEAVAYACLSANVKFTLPFLENRKPHPFSDSAGDKTPISSFGIREEDHDAYPRLRAQVQILHSKNMEYGGLVGRSFPTPEFIVDPCRDSSPNQLLLACIPIKETLAATLAQLGNTTGARNFGPGDRLLVPDILFDLTHHFKELEGPDKVLLNPGFSGLWVGTAVQQMRFKLDRSGAELYSWSMVTVMGGNLYAFDRPFLIVMKKRGATEPFFVMWVDNAELLCRP